MKILPLVINNLNFNISNNKILKDINLNSNEKKITIIAGNNGSGKSTLLKILHGLIETPRNTIQWGGFSIPEIKQSQSMVFQSPILLNRTTYENLLYVIKNKKIKDKYYIDKIIEKLNLKSIEKVNAKYISGGERQKVAIAMSIIGEPRIIFLDEPTSQLDPTYKNEIESIINDLSENETKIFMTSHDIAQIKRIGKEIIFLDKGEVTYNDTVEKFFKDEQSELIKNYIHYG